MIAACERADRGHVRDLSWLAIFNLMLFAPAIQAATGFSLIDEVSVLLLAVVSAVRCHGVGMVRGLPARNLAVCFGFLMLMVALGLVGNLVFAIRTEALPIAIDIFAFVKFPVAVCCAYLAFRDSAQLFDHLVAEAKALIVIMLACALANLLFDVGMGIDGRLGLRASFRFVMPHPTYVSFACAGLMLLLLPDWRKKLPWISGCLVVCALTLRMKSLAFVALVGIMLFATRGGRRPSPVYGVLCAIAIVSIGADQAIYYFTSPGFARTELVRAALQVAGDHFPLGTGFATFGSSVTAGERWYSPLYYDYGLSGVWGLEPGDTFFLSDAFWSTVLAQLGWIGLAVYVAMLGALLVALLALRRDLAGPTLCCFAYLLISSAAESAFFNPQAVFLAFCLGVVLAAAAPLSLDDVPVDSEPGEEGLEPIPTGGPVSSVREADGLPDDAPLVSVIVPIYRCERYLGGCIESILGQTLQDIEVVLVDDGSPDASGAIAEDYAARDTRVKVIHRSNRGCPQARNDGIAAATGAFVGFVDADDWIEPRMFERLLDVAVRAEAPVAFGGMKEVRLGEVARVLEQPFAGNLLRDEDAIGRFRCRFYGDMPCKGRGGSLYGSAAVGLYRRSFLMEHGILFKDTFSEDIVFNLEVLRAAPAIVFAAGADYCYRKDGQDSRTGSFSERTVAEYFSLFRRLEYMASEEPKNLADECQLRVRRFVIDYSRVLIRLIGRSSSTRARKRELMRSVCNGDALRLAGEGYPFWKLPLGQAIFLLCLRARAVRTLELLVWLRGLL